MHPRRALAPLLGALVLGTAIFRVRRAFVRDMDAAYDRITGRTRVIATTLGDVEILEGGSGEGTPALVVHGSGGGFDQGELLARAALGPDVRWIAPSRFGYLRSTFQPGATFDEQAHAFAALLDALGVARVHVLALSHGGPSALLLAALHPARVASLTLISAGVASSGDETQAEADAKGRALTTIFQHDALYWAMTRALRRPFLALMGVDAAVVERMTPEAERLVGEIVDFMNREHLRASDQLDRSPTR